MLNFHAIPASSAHNCSAVELQLFQPIFTKVSCIAFITIYILLWYQSKPSKFSKYKFLAAYVTCLQYQKHTNSLNRHVHAVSRYWKILLINGMSPANKMSRFSH